MRLRTPRRSCLDGAPRAVQQDRGQFAHRGTSDGSHSTLRAIAGVPFHRAEKAAAPDIQVSRPGRITENDTEPRSARLSRRRTGRYYTRSLPIALDPSPPI